MPTEMKKGFQEIDFRAGVNAAVCALLYMLVFHFVPGIDHYLNVCVLSIAAVFITEIEWKKAWSAGLTRCAIMGLGVVFGLVIVFLDGVFQNDFALCILFGAAVICLLAAEKLACQMYVQCKLGTVSMTLTIFTFREAFYAQVGKTCFGYGVMFFLSTIAAVPVCVITMLVWDAVRSTLRKK